MSNYELSILGGSIILLIGLIKFFSSVTSRGSVMGGLFIMMVGGGLLAYANTLTLDGLNPGDIPKALYKAIAYIIN